MWMAALHSLNLYLGRSYSVSAVAVVSTAKTNFYDKAFMAAAAHDVPLVLIIGQSLLYVKCKRHRRGVNSAVTPWAGQKAVVTTDLTCCFAVEKCTRTKAVKWDGVSVSISDFVREPPHEKILAIRVEVKIILYIHLPLWFRKWSPVASQHCPACGLSAIVFLCE